MKQILLILNLLIYLSAFSQEDTVQTKRTASLASVQKVNTRSDLKALSINNGKIAFLVSKNSLGDNLGGFYYFDSTATHTEDTVFMNNIPSNIAAVGSWVRIFQKAVNYTQGILVNNGGVKTMYCPATTNSTGQVVVYLTDNNLSTGNTLYKEVWLVTCMQSPNTTNSNSPIIGYGIVSGDLKTVTCYFYKNNQTTLGSTLLSIAGLVINGVTAAPASVPVQIKIEGN